MLPLHTYHSTRCSFAHLPFHDSGLYFYLAYSWIRHNEGGFRKGVVNTQKIRLTEIEARPRLPKCWSAHAQTRAAAPSAASPDQSVITMHVANWPKVACWRCHICMATQKGQKEFVHDKCTAVVFFFHVCKVEGANV